MANSKAGILGVAILAIGLCTPAVAENADNLSVLNEIVCCGVSIPPSYGVMAVSPDGMYEARLGWHAFEFGLVVRNLKTYRETLEEKLIFKDASGVGVSGDLAFSPDGTHLLFTTGFSTIYPTTIWMIHPDGSELRQLASETDSLDDTDPSGKTYLGIFAVGPSFSPDGTKILVTVWKRRGKLDQYGRIDIHDNDNNKYYVALLSPAGTNQVPEIVVEGLPLFWSSDGSAIYFAKWGDLKGIYRYELATKDSHLMPHAMDYRQIIGKVPGQDAVFAWSSWNSADRTILVANLDGTTASPESVETAKKIPLKDAEGRGLLAIKSVGPHQLFLTYSGTLLPPPPAEVRVTSSGLPLSAEVHGEFVSIQ